MGDMVRGSRKKNGTKSQRSGGVSMAQGSGQPQQLQKRNESTLRISTMPRQTEASNESAKVTKRKLSPQGIINGPVIDNIIQHIVNEPNQRA